MYPAKIEEGQTSSFRAVEEIIPAPVSEVALAGRIMLHRSFGKICFATINDGTGRIQILFSRENCSIIVDSEKRMELTSETEPVTAYKFAEKLIDL
jgi:lysyl-tRNA synthetase class II